MCAITGWAGKITTPLLRNLFAGAAPYGPHAVGLSYADESGLNTFKRAVNPAYFLRNCNHRIERAAKFTLGFGHVRYATHGSHTDENSHPFEYEGIVYAHNGVISNYHQLRPGVVVDSECLGPLIKERRVGEADGSVGLVWFEQTDSGLQLFVYQHRQNLMAMTWDDGDGAENALTLVASREIIIPRALRSVSHTTWKLETGVAYRVTNTGLEAVWQNEIAMPGVWHRDFMNRMKAASAAH